MAFIYLYKKCSYLQIKKEANKYIGLSLKSQTEGPVKGLLFGALTGYAPSLDFSSARALSSISPTR